MSVLWFAFGIYILGVALVLFIRPALMFHSGSGTWKEFGLGRSGNYTLFPFWMFSLSWAFISYALATLLTIFFGTTALKGLPTQPMNNIVQPISSSVPALPTRVVNESMVAKATPGYYVLETPASGPPKYVYFGSEPPTISNISPVASTV